MFCKSITNDGLSKSKVYSCSICGLGVKADYFMCVKCGNLVQSKFTAVNVIAKSKKIFRLQEM